VRAVVFSGPSLPPSCLPAGAAVTWRPPLRRGDFRRAVEDGADILGVVDGVFETGPTVWHEEILEALDRGKVVFGAASIGALRAVELAPFGMIGVGEIFTSYRDGLLEADEEVALLHAPAELDYAPLTEPTVNVRATMRSFLECSRVAPAVADLVVGLARRTFYKRRTWQGLLQDAADAGLPREVTAALDRDLARHSVDQKRRDARALLVRVEREARARPAGLSGP
jgi:hypothetical protein